MRRRDAAARLPKAESEGREERVMTMGEANMQEEMKAAKTWREQRRERVCGDKVLVVRIRPEGEGSWLILDRIDDIEDHILEGDPGDKWEMDWQLMTREELDALPEHDGW